jgi:type II secretory pathway pseudopilin PulG
MISFRANPLIFLLARTPSHGGPRQNARGPLLALTLLEVIIAAFIFSGLVTVLSSLWVMHARAQRQSGMMLVAADLADLQMSRALAQGYNSVVPSSDSFTQTWVVRGQTIDHVFSASVEVEPILDDDGNPMGMKLIVVNVTFGDGTDQPKTFRLESVLADENNA